MTNPIRTLLSAITLACLLVTNTSADEHAATPATASWTDVISTNTISDEVTRLHKQLESNTSTAEKFSQGGFLQARQQLTELAMLLAIVQRRDDPTDWKQAAPHLQQQFSRAAGVCKVNTPQVFKVVKEATDSLQSLLQDEDLPNKQVKKDVPWAEIVERSPLMSRMEQWHDALHKNLADKTAFENNREQIKQDAELIATVATVLRQPTMEDASDAEYAAHTKNLSRHASLLARVVDRGDFMAAKVAGRLLVKNCANCHENYR